MQIAELRKRFVGKRVSVLVFDRDGDDSLAHVIGTVREMTWDRVFPGQVRVLLGDCIQVTHGQNPYHREGELTVSVTRTGKALELI